MDPGGYKMLGYAQPFLCHDTRESIICHAYNSCHERHFVCGSSEGSVSLIDIENMSLVASAPKIHASCITDIAFLKENHRHCFMTSSRDGFIRINDSRLSLVNQQCIIIPVTSQHIDVDLLSVAQGGPGGYYIACALDNTLPVYDLRLTPHVAQGQPTLTQRNGVACLNDSHSDMINVVRFHPTYPSVLVSGGDDNLLVIHDVSRLTTKDLCATSNLSMQNDQDSDSCHLRILNNDASPRLLSFVGPGLSTLGVISTIETVSLWSFASLCHALRENRTDEMNGNEKEYAPLKLGRVESSSSPITHKDRSYDSSSSLYIVNMFYDESSTTLWCIAGSFEGQLALYQLSSTAYLFFSHFQDSPLSHSGVIRSGSHVPSNKNDPVLATSGDDGYFFLWSRS